MGKVLRYITPLVVLAVTALSFSVYCFILPGEWGFRGALGIYVIFLVFLPSLIARLIVWLMPIRKGLKIIIESAIVILFALWLVINS